MITQKAYKFPILAVRSSLQLVIPSWLVPEQIVLLVRPKNADRTYIIDYKPKNLISKCKVLIKKYKEEE
jgi:hypothetical protein